MTPARLFCVPLGAPYAVSFTDGFLARFGDRAPADLARIMIIANTARMATAIREALSRGEPRLLPRILTLADLSRLTLEDDLPEPAEPLALRLELTQLVRRLLEADPGIAPPDAAFDIAGSLLALLGEMAGEGVGIDDLRRLDLSRHSAHWARSLQFIDLIAAYLDRRGAALEPEAHARLVVETLVRRWQIAPPACPVVVAGSTGSRGTTRRLMEAVAQLSEGYVVLPGVDRSLPGDVWTIMGEGHPQFRFRALIDALGLAPDDLEIWAGTPADTARARVLSLALRPPPVTDQWLSEGRTLPDLPSATSAITLVEAPGPRSEAVAIALGLRAGVERGKRVALVTPDRVLTRRVAAALSRWGIEADDSAGRPLALSAPGRLLRQAAEVLTDGADADRLLALLKHPLTATGSDRGPHLLHTRDFELWLRRRAAPFAGAASIAAFFGKFPARQGWCDWIATLLEPVPDVQADLEVWLDTLLSLAGRIVAGPDGGPQDELWAGPAGDAAKAALEALGRAAPSAGPVSPRDASRILEGVLQAEVRDPVVPHADVMFRGTLEVRPLDADLVMLAGLNEDVWPPAPDPDPWLNRALRADAGLLSPERRTGLSAHDFEIAFSAPEIWLSRSMRGGEGETTVPSRWLNRLTGLIGGLSPRALCDMRERGETWVRLAERLDRRATPVPPAPRPAPRPPVEARPRTISVTEVQKLIRDPYAIYARRVLGLEALPPPVTTPDARLRGEALHDIVEAFVRRGVTGNLDEDRAALLEIAEEIFRHSVPLTVTRTLWRARLERIADRFLAGEYGRLEAGSPVALEISGECVFSDPKVTLTGKADRIDRRADGLAIWDYKSGPLPTAEQVRHFDRQLLLEAVMAERGAFAGVAEDRVVEVGHIGLGSDPETRSHDLTGAGSGGYDTETVAAQFLRLMAAYLDPQQGYAARRAMEKVSYDGDYDHLARFGEWDDTATPEPEDLA